MAAPRRSARERKQTDYSMYSSQSQDDETLQDGAPVTKQPNNRSRSRSPAKTSTVAKKQRSSSSSSRLSSSSSRKRKPIAGAVSDDDGDDDNNDDARTNNATEEDEDLVHEDDNDNEEQEEEEPPDSDEELPSSSDDESSSSEDEDFQPVAVKKKAPSPKKQAATHKTKTTNNANKTATNNNAATGSSKSSKTPKQALSLSFKLATAAPTNNIRSRRKAPGTASGNAASIRSLSATAQRKKLATHMLNAAKRILGPKLLQQQDAKSKDLPLFVQILQSYKLSSGGNNVKNTTPLLHHVYSHHEASSLLPQQPYYLTLTGDCIPFDHVSGDSGKPASTLTMTTKAQALNVEEIARKVVETANSGDVNAAHCELLNFLFSSLGGACFPPTAAVKAAAANENDDGEEGQKTASISSSPRMELLDPSQHDLEDMTNDTWIELLHKLVEWMRNTPPDQILLCADPHGLMSKSSTNAGVAGHSGTTGANGSTSFGTMLPGATPVLPMNDLPTPPTAGEQVSREYRRLFSEFWYVLTMVALTEGGSSGGSSSTPSSSLQAMGIPESDDDEDDDEDEEEDFENDDTNKKSKAKKKKKSTSSGGGQRRMPSLGTPSRFDAAFVRDVIHRVTELVAVGQPDIRAAATLAAMQMGHAVLERTVQLRQKLFVAQRQFDAAVGNANAAASSKTGGKRNSRGGGGSNRLSNKVSPPVVLGEKAESLRVSIESLKRTCEELEQLVTGPVMNGIFMHRYRDSHPYIRSTCLAALTKMTLQRPDIFLKDKYLKYFGWMMSDKVEVVRYHALRGLLAPFEATEKNGGVASSLAVASSTRGGAVAENIQLNLLENVTSKFLKRIADCTRDVSTNVQEQAMKLLLLMLRRGFLDELDDDEVWDSINIRAVASKNSSHKVRRDALYFIMEQLEPFDDDGDAPETTTAAATSKSSKKSNKPSGNLESLERTATQRVDALASWLAQCITDGPIPLDQIRVELTDCLVMSIRDMPEHKDSLATNWSAMLRAISEDAATNTTATNPDGSTVDGDRVDVAKQRVLVRFLATAALAEVGAVAGSDFFSSSDDATAGGSAITGRMQENALMDSPASLFSRPISSGKRSKKQKASAHHPHETLSVALLKALPDLLVKFNGDPAILESLTRLPRYLLPSVFSLPQRQGEFTKLLQRLSSVYMQTQDDEILGNIAVSLAHFGGGGGSSSSSLSTSTGSGETHLRTEDVQQHLRKMTCYLVEKKLLPYLNTHTKHNEEDESTLGTLTQTQTQTQMTIDGDDETTNASPTSATTGTRSRRSSSRRSSSRIASRSSAASAATSPSSRSSSSSTEVTKDAREEDELFSFALNLRRFLIMSKRCNVVEFLDSASSSTSNESIANNFFDLLTKFLSQLPEVARDPSNRGKSSRFYQSLANAFQDGLNLLLGCTAWKLHTFMDAISLPTIATSPKSSSSYTEQDEGSKDGEDVAAKTSTSSKTMKMTEPVSDDSLRQQVEDIVMSRDELCDLIAYAGNEAVPAPPPPARKGGGTPATQSVASASRAGSTTLGTTATESDYVPRPAERAFMASMQLSCSRVSNDLRTLFPKEWSLLRKDGTSMKAKLLGELALTNESKLIATSIKCLRANQQHLKVMGDTDHEKDAVQTLLLPILRSIAANWKGFGNRREAGVALSFLTEAGKESSVLVSLLNKYLKRSDPVRFLEAQMACLRQAYEEWINNEPEELESDHPTEEEMAQYEEEEKAHNAQFQALEVLATKLSQCLGVGKLSPSILQGVLGFAKEGIRYSFSDDEEGTLVLGSRLSFLALVSKYAVWIKKQKTMRTELAIELQVKEGQLRSHPDFHEVHEDDIKTLMEFRAALGLKSSKKLFQQAIPQDGTGSSVATSDHDSIAAGAHDDQSQYSAASSSFGGTSVAGGAPSSFRSVNAAGSVASTLVSNIGRRTRGTGGGGGLSSVASSMRSSGRSTIMSPVFEGDSVSASAATQATNDSSSSADVALSVHEEKEEERDDDSDSDNGDEDSPTQSAEVARSATATARTSRSSNMKRKSATEHVHDDGDGVDDDSQSASSASSSPRKRRRA